MPNVLLVIPPGVEPRRARDQAIETARRLGGSLVALVVLDPAETARIASTLDSAFMGDRLSDRVVEVLAREARGRAEDLLATIAAEAKQRGVSFTPLVEEGDPSEVCTRVIRAQDIAVAVLVAEKRSWLSRFLSGGADVRLPALAGCEVRVVEED
jgi:nucleotide-binding universal stress UspA family protein